MAKVYWNDAWLRKAVRAAFRAATFQAKASAQTRAWSMVRRRVNVKFGGSLLAYLGSSHPLAHIQELGAGPHGISPRNRFAMKFPDGGFARGSVSHPGADPEPFLQPELPIFPGRYRENARRRIGGAGI